MSKVTIPAKHYVGMVMRSASRIPLGFITPWGEDAAAQKRMATVDNWASSSRNGSMPTSVIDNIPMIGFKMSGDIRRGMRGGQDKWRVEDPRGFELEITSENLSMLLADTTLEKGEILDKCVWAREGGQNLLLTVESEEYIEAVRMTEIATSTASWKDAKLGYTVTLQNGIKGRYLGRMHTLQEKYRDETRSHDSLIESAGKLMHVILCSTTEHTYPPGVCREMHFITSPKLSSVEPGVEITVADAELEANEALRDPKCYVVKGSYRDVILAASNTIKDLSWKLTLDDLPDDADPWDRTYMDPLRFARMKDGSIGVCRRSGSDHTICLIREDDLPKGIYDYQTSQRTYSHRGYYGRGGDNRWDGVTTKIDPLDVSSFHLLRIEVTTKAGNVLWNHL